MLSHFFHSIISLPLTFPFRRLMGFLSKPLFLLINPSSWNFTSIILIISPTPITSITMSTISFTSSLSSNPLFSSIVTLYLLILLYFPYLFLHLFLSPIFFSTLILLLSLLRLGVSQQIRVHNDPNSIQAQPSPEPEPEPKPTQHEAETEPYCIWAQTQQEPDFDPAIEPEPKPKPAQQEVQTEPHCIWAQTQQETDLGGPLEVIYEAYEGEEEEEDVQNDAFEQGNCRGKTERYPSLSRYFPESDSESVLDSGSGSDSDSSESLWGGEFKGIEEWDEDEREGLIEIALDYDGEKQGIKKLMEVVQFDDEDNLIEIDISPTRINHAFFW